MNRFKIVIYFQGKIPWKRLSFQPHIRLVNSWWIQRPLSRVKQSYFEHLLDHFKYIQICESNFFQTIFVEFCWKVQRSNISKLLNTFQLWTHEKLPRIKHVQNGKHDMLEKKFLNNCLFSVKNSINDWFFQVKKTVF